MTTEPRRPKRVRDWSHAWVLATATVCFGAFMGQLDASVVTLIYRPLERHFNGQPAAIQWVSLVYLVVLVSLLAPMGRRSDRTGRKLSYIHGFAIFTVASAACGLAPGLLVLIGARAVQAVGAALMQANSVALITRAAPAPRLRLALGVQAAAQAIGLALGPTAGGLVVAALGWRWVFAINVPVGVVGILASILFLPRTTEKSAARRTDPAGAVLLGVCATAGLLALSAVSGLRVTVVETAALVVVTGVAAAGLVWRQKVAATPVLSRRVLAAPGVAPGLIGAMLAYLVLFGPLVLVPLGLETGGSSALRAGLVVTALPAGFALAATLGTALVPHRWGNRRRAVFGAAVAAASLALGGLVMFRLPGLVLWLVGLGAGLGLLSPANNASIMGAVPADTTASAGGTLNMARSLGTAIGVSVVTLAVHAGGYRTGVVVLLGAAVLAMITLMAVPKESDGAPALLSGLAAEPGPAVRPVL